MTLILCDLQQLLALSVLPYPCLKQLPLTETWQRELPSPPGLQVTVKLKGIRQQLSLCWLSRWRAFGGSGEG